MYLYIEEGDALAWLFLITLSHITYTQTPRYLTKEECVSVHIHDIRLKVDRNLGSTVLRTPRSNSVVPTPSTLYPVAIDARSTRTFEMTSV